MSGATEIDEVWMVEQLSHFQPGDLDEAVQIMRGWARRERDRTDRRQVGDAA